MKLYSYLGFARVSGQLVSGQEQTEKVLRSGRARLLIVAADASDQTRERFIRLAKRTDTPYAVVGDKARLGKSVGKSQRSVLCVKDRQLARAIQKALAEEV